MDKRAPVTYTSPVNLEKLFRDGTARIGVVGLGYVGLPLAVEFARAGFRVVGVEASPARTKSLKRGRSYIEDVPDSEIKRLTEAGLLKVRPDGRELGRCDAVIICVQTPLRKTKEPD